jgi:hypothetical protein
MNRSRRVRIIALILAGLMFLSVFAVVLGAFVR